MIACFIRTPIVLRVPKHRPQDWHLLGFHWQSNFYYAVVLVFGVKTAPYIFNLFAEALHWIFQRHLPGDLRHYLDDFLLAFHPSTSLQTTNRAVTWCQDLCNQLGLSTQEEKTVRPCTCLEFLGLEVDTSLMEARLPIDKLSFLRQTLTDWSSKQTTNLRELQQLTGFLQFASQVIPHSRAFLRRLIDFSTTFRSPFAIRRIPAYAHADIIWWQTFADAWNGKRFIGSSYTTTHVYTDASGTKGLGGIFHPYWYSSRVPRRFRKRDIQFKEIYAVLQAILRWGHLWRHCHVIFHIDNSAIVDALSKETNRSRFTMSIVRLIVMLSASLEFSFSASWLSSSMNFLADSASCFLYSHLFSLSPSLNRQNSSTNPHLIGIKRMLTSRLRSPSSFGTGSPQAQGVPTAPDNAHILTSSLCTHASSIPTGHISLPIKQQCLNGSLTSVHRGASSPQQSRHTWVTSKLFTLMPIVPSKLSKPPLHRGSSVVSNATLVTAPANQPPMTLDILHRLVAVSQPTTSLTAANVDAAIKLAFFGFMRSGEFTIKTDKHTAFDPSTHLTRGSINFYPSFNNPTYLTVTFPASKTDPFRKGVTISIASVNARTCAVKALQHLFRTDPRAPDAPLFCNPDGSPLQYSIFISQLRLLLANAGYDASQYSGHSFRRGAASSAAQAGFTEYEIQQLGRWRSDAYKLYIDASHSRLLNLSTRLHWAVPTVPHFEPPSLPVTSYVA